MVREVRQAAMQLEQNRQRIETTRLGRELSEQRLDAEQKRFEVGMSTNFNVIQAQRDLAVARNAELLAQLDYQLALIAYETVLRDTVRGAKDRWGHWLDHVQVTQGAPAPTEA